MIPYSDGHILPVIYNNSNINSEEHTKDGTVMDITVDTKTFNLVSDYIV